MSEPVAPVPHAPTAPKKRRWGRRLGVLFLVSLVLLGVAAWAAPGLIAKSGYKDRLIADAAKDLNGKVEVGAISLAWFHAIEFHDVTVTDADGRKALTAAKVSTSKTLLDLALNRSDIGTITVEKPRLEVVVKDGTTNLEQVLAKYLTDTTPQPPERTPIRVVATDATVVLIDPARNETTQIDGVNVTVGVPRSRSEPVTLAATAKASGELKADGEFGDGGKVKLTADGFDIASLGPLLRRFDATTTAGGKLTATGVLGWGAGGFTADGTLAAADLTVQSDFLGARLRGHGGEFVAAVNLDLDKLPVGLVKSLALEEYSIAGSVRNLIVRTQAKDGGGWTLTADGTVTNLAVLDKDGKGIQEPSLTLKAQADGTGGRMDTGTVKVTAGGDVLDVKLVEPISDVKALASGKAQVNLTGDLARWRSRVGPLVGFPKEWDLGGTAKQASAVVSLGEVVTARSVKLTVSNAVFRGAGLDVAEPELKLETSDKDGGAITYDRKTGVTAFQFATLTSDTISGATNRFEIKPDATGEYGASGKWNVVARLDRVQKTLRMQSDPALADQLRGVAKGTVELNAPTFNRVGFAANLNVDQFAFGPPAAPSWTEPWVTVKADGEYDLPADALTLRSAEVKRDGFTATGKGRVGKLTTDVELDLSGDLAYDLAKLEPQLKQYLGKSAAAAGKHTKPFRIAGNLLDGGKNLSVAVGAKPAGKADLTRLNGNAAVAWQSLRAYGFDVGQSELKATVDKGLVTTTPVEATFGGGKIRVEPTLRLNPGAYDLTFQKGKVIESAKLTPAACAEAIGFALPAIANSAQADGTISFDLGDNRIPLAAPTRGTVKGNLTVHDATVSPGPVVAQLIEAFGMDTPKLQVKKGSVVPIRMENGRVHHADFVLNVGNTPITTAGSVGTDGTLDLTVSVPIGSTLAEKLVPGNRPVIQKVLAQQTVTVAIGGTLTKPTLNREAMKGQLAKIVQGAMKDAVKEAGAGVADDLIKKGLEGIFKKK